MSSITNSVRLSERRAFTLVELLVVVAIIALLVSILLPTLGRAKILARTVKCMTNMHAIGRATYLYATDNGDYIPRGAANQCNVPGHVNHGCYQFAVKFSHYVGGPKIPFEYDDDWDEMYNYFKEIPAYQCPGFKDPEYALTYIVNARNFDYPPGYKELCATKMSSLPCAAADIGYITGLNPENPSQAPSGSFGSYDFWDNYSGGWYGPQLTYADNGDPNAIPRIIRHDDMRHGGNAAISFFDGHAESRIITPKNIPAELFFPPKERDRSMR